jgi:hypothetical protein
VCTFVEGSNPSALGVTEEVGDDEDADEDEDEDEDGEADVMEGC